MDGQLNGGWTDFSSFVFGWCMKWFPFFRLINYSETVWVILKSFFLCSMFDRGVPDITAPQCWKEGYRWNLLGTTFLSSFGARREGRLRHSGSSAHKQGQESKGNKAGGLLVSRESRSESIRLGWLQGVRQTLSRSRTAINTNKRLGVVYCKLINEWILCVIRIVIIILPPHYQKHETIGAQRS